MDEKDKRIQELNKKVSDLQFEVDTLNDLIDKLIREKVDLLEELEAIRYAKAIRTL